VIAALETRLRHRWLLWSFTRREVARRFRGSVTGAAWAVVHPLALLAVYAAIFTVVFRVQLPASFAGTSYATVVALALWPWMMFSEGLTKGLASIEANAGLIRKVAFPHRLLVHAAVGANFAIHIAGFLAVIVVLRLAGEPVRLSGLPAALLLLVPLALVTVGVAAFLAALQTLLKDIEHLVGIALTVVFYATPVLYPLELVPPGLREWAAANPLGYPMERIRQVLLEGGFLVAGDAFFLVASLAIAWLGLAFFDRLSPYFEDFL